MELRVKTDTSEVPSKTSPSEHGSPACQSNKSNTLGLLSGQDGSAQSDESFFDAYDNLAVRQIHVFAPHILNVRAGWLCTWRRVFLDSL